MQALRERVIAKRRRLVEQYRRQQQQQEEQDPAGTLVGNRSSTASSSSRPKKAVSFDFTKNTVHHSCVDQQDLENLWLSNDDFELIQGSARDTVTLYRHCLELHRNNSKNNNNNLSGDDDGADAINACLASICMRGLEHRATDNLTLDKIRRIKQYRALLLSQQRLAVQQWGCVDSKSLATLSRNLTTRDVHEAAEAGYLDAKEAIQFENGLKSLPSTFHEEYHSGVTALTKSKLSCSLTTQLPNNPQLIIPSRPNARTSSILNSPSFEKILSKVK